MKRRRTKTVCIIVILLMIVGIVSYYCYDVFVAKTHYMENLFRTLALVFLLLGTLIRLAAGGRRRKNLAFYENAYKTELGYAFNHKPFLRKKLLCACRLYDEGNYRKALKYLHQLKQESESYRETVPILLFAALCYTDAGFLREAIKVYNHLLEVDSHNAQAHSNLGTLYIKTGDFEKALEQYNQAIESKPDHYYAYLNRANYYFRMHAYENAIEDAQKALEIKNNGAEAASLLTIIFAQQKDEENKKKYFHIAITSGKNPDDLNAAIRYYLSVEESTEDTTETEEEKNET